jgi:hypothetical protein
VFRRREPTLDREEVRGALLLLMNIDDNVSRIREEIVDDDGQEEEEEHEPP